MEFDFKKSFDRIHKETINAMMKNLEDIGATLEADVNKGFIDSLVNVVVKGTTDSTAKVMEEYHQILMKNLSEKEGNRNG